MNIRLVRASSETPNITNKDDAKMIRYAYGGYDGVVKDFRSELEASLKNNDQTFHIGSGRVVLQGWEVDIDEDGWDFNSDFTSGTRYYSIYLEVNLVTEAAYINSQYGTGDYPNISLGDDLTQASSGIARIVLYKVYFNAGKVITYEKVVSAVPYLAKKVLDLTERISNLTEGISNGKIPAKIANYASNDESKGTIEERLTKLGFKSGVITFAGESYGSETYTNTENNGIYRQGNYVFCRIKIQDKKIKLREDMFGTIPELFRPKKETFFTVAAHTPEMAGLLCKIGENGVITQILPFGNTNEWVTYGLNNTYIEFGYEAPPIA